MERLRCTGMSITQMREYTELVKQGGATLEQRRALLGKHQAGVRDNITRWTEALALIDAKIEFYDEWVTNGERPAVTPQARVSRAKNAGTAVVRPRAAAARSKDGAA
jgi:hypothetical protein